MFSWPKYLTDQPFLSKPSFTEISATRFPVPAARGVHNPRWTKPAFGSNFSPWYAIGTDRPPPAGPEWTRGAIDGHRHSVSRARRALHPAAASPYVATARLP